MRLFWPCVGCNNAETEVHSCRFIEETAMEAIMDIYLIVVHLTGVYLIGVHLIAMYITGVHLIAMYITGVHLMARTSWAYTS